MGKPDSSCTFGNFDLWLEEILAPAGVKFPPTADYQLRLAVQPCGATTAQTFLVPMSQLQNLDVEKCASGCIYQTKGEKKQAIAYIREQASLLMRQRSTGLYISSTGWYRLNGKSVFCTGNELLPVTAGCQLDSCSLPRSGVHLKRQENQDINAVACEFCESLWTHPEYRIPAYSYAISSALRSRWEEADLPFAAVLLIVGPSDTGKTTLAKNFCQVFDSEGGGIADYWDAKTTQAALKDALYEARDRTVLYDDVCKSTNPAEARRRMDNAVNLLRHVANESDEGKKSGKETVHQICRAGLVITAETPPVAWSEMTRCILIQVEKFRIGGTSADRRLAADMLHRYLEWFSQHDEIELEELRCSRALFTTDKYPGFSRLYTSMMQANWCFESFMRFLETIPSCKPYVGQQRKQEVGQIYGQLFQEEMQFICGLEQKELSLEKQILAGIQSGELPYMVHKGFCCVQFDALMTFLRRNTRNPSLSERHVSTYLRTNKLIDTDASQRVSKKVDGRRYVFLRLERFKI